MTGLAGIIIKTAPRKTPPDRRAGSTALCVAGPGATIPGASAFRSATMSLQTKEASTTAFVVAWKRSALDGYSCRSPRNPIQP